MLRFVLRRIVFAIVLVFVVASASFVLVRLAPGDYFSEFGPGAERRAQAERAAAGFDRPLPVQYASWLARAARFDFGTSLKFQRPVWELVAPRALNTALLGLCALLVASLIGIPVGVFTGVGDAGMLRGAVRGISSALLALPPLVVALALTTVAARSGWLASPGLRFSNLILPALALALPAAAVIERTHSQAVRAVLSQPHVLAAMARGLAYERVVWRYAVRGALGPLLGIYGVLAGTLLSGSFAVELVADWPGLALLMAEAVLARDPFLVCGCAAAAAAVLAGVMLLSDVLHVWADPRIGES